MINLNNAVVQLLDEFLSIAGRRYPNFVYGGAFPGERQEVPVFVFHTISPDTFEKQLRYLKENNYNTVTCEEYFQWSVNGKRIPKKSILLAIDDGHRSVWQFAYPLLKKYELKGVVFVIPGYTRSRPRYFNNLLDVWSGKCSLEDVIDSSDDTSNYYNLMYWEELKAVESEGVLDVQSHSLYHHQVFQDDVITDVFVPDSRKAFFDWVLPDGYETHVNNGTIEDFTGTPLYRSNSFFKTHNIYIDCDDFRQSSIDCIKNLGGIEFLQQEKSAKKIAVGELNRLRKKYSGGHYLNGGKANSKIMENLGSSKKLLEEKLGKDVDHLCYPYSLYSKETISLSKRVGFKSNFLGTYPGRSSNFSNDDPMYTVRVKSDYMGTLPGPDRSSIFSVITNKIRYRINGKKYL